MTATAKQAVKRPRRIAYFPPEDSRKLLADYQHLRALHDELVAALRDVVDAYTTRFGRGGNYLGPIDEEIKQARAALKHAEE